MPIKSLLAIVVFAVGCTAVKYNAHVGPDGSGGYLRTYYSSEKNRVHAHSDGTGIEQCKPQGSDVICRDLNIQIVLSEKKPGEVVPQQPVAPAKAAKAPIPAAKAPAKR